MRLVQKRFWRGNISILLEIFKMDYPYEIRTHNLLFYRRPLSLFHWPSRPLCYRGIVTVSCFINNIAKGIWLGLLNIHWRNIWHCFKLSSYGTPHCKKSGEKLRKLPNNLIFSFAISDQILFYDILSDM
jgi:hypothetical protein